jgi:hypothetical protein
VNRPGGTTETTGQTAPRRGSRFLRHAIVLYPAAWRRRYGDEFEALLEQTRLTPRILFDVAVAAVDAHLNPTAPLRKWPFMFERLRASELAVFAGWILFVVSGLGFSKMTEDSAFGAAGGANPAVGLAYDAFGVGAVVALLGVLAAGVPIAWAIARSAFRTHRWRQLSLLAVPPVSLAVWIGVTFLLVNAVDKPVPDGAIRVVYFVAWVAVFSLAAVVSTVAVTVAAINGEVAPGLYRRAVTPALIVAGAMAIVVLALAVWGLALLATTPSLFWGNGGVLATSTALTWLGVVAGMGAGAAVAIRGAAVAWANRFA